MYQIWNFDIPKLFFLIYLEILNLISDEKKLILK